MRARIRSELARPVVQTFLATVAINVFGVLTGALLARALGPVGRGELAAAILWPTLLRFFVMLGGVDAIVYRAARPDARIGRLAGTALGLGVLQIGVLLALGLVLLPLILADYSDEAVVASLIYLGVLAVAVVGLYMGSILNGTHRYRAFNVLSVAVIGLGAALMVVLAAIDQLTVETAALCYLGGVLPTTLVAFEIVRRIEGIERPDRELGRELISYGWRSQPSSTRNTLNEQLDQLVVSIFLSAAQLGLYVVGYTVTIIIGFLSAAASVVTLPAVARTEEAERRRALVRRNVGLTFVTAALLAAVIAAIAGPLIELVFGADFTPAADTTRILLLAAAIAAPTRVGVAALNGLGRPGDAGIAGLITLAATGAGLAALIPPFGLEGAAFGVLAGTLAGATWCFTRLGRHLSASPLTLLIPTLRRGTPPSH
jgi:O-antigen/teichoic acid export membrane protein